MVKVQQNVWPGSFPTCHPQFSIMNTRHQAPLTKTVCLYYHPKVFLMPMYIISSCFQLSENQSQPHQHEFSKSTTLSIWGVYGQWSHKCSKWWHVTALLHQEGHASWFSPLSIPTATVIRILCILAATVPHLNSLNNECINYECSVPWSLMNEHDSRCNAQG